jgi:hypothetical protein
MTGGGDKSKSFHQLDTLISKLEKSKSQPQSETFKPNDESDMNKYERQRKAKHFFIGKRSLNNQNLKRAIKA